MSFDPNNNDSTETPLWLTSPEIFHYFVAAWQDCTLPKEAFTHAAHVAVAAHFIAVSPEDALAQLRSGIRRFNEAVGGANTADAGYHETLTRFWTILVARHVPAGATPLRAARAATAEFGHRRDLHTLYYSFDVVRSTEARRLWIPPDLTGPFGPIP